MTSTRFFKTGLALIGLLAVGASANADTRQDAIAVPAIGTQGPASLYPSLMRLSARGGQTQESNIAIVLHAVTHPCLEELAILLVHETDRYLLMSNAGGCRPLQGTTIRFSVGGTAIPNSQAADPPYGQQINVTASNYGTPPVFPARRRRGRTSSACRRTRRTSMAAGRSS